MFSNAPCGRAAMSARPLAAALLLAGAASLVSCATPAGGSAQSPQSVAISFDARIGDRPAKCGETYHDVGLARADLTLQDFRIYVSEVRLLTSDGREVPVSLTPDGQWQNDKVALLDFENATGNCNGNAPTNTVIRGAAAAGDYTGVAFEIGVPFDLNHRDPTVAPAPLNYSGLTWPWRLGYKFVTIDLETGAGAKGGHGGAQGGGSHSGPQAGMHAMAASGFSIHLGSTACGEGSPMTAPAAPCENPNRAAYRLTGFNPAKQKVVLDLGALLAKTDITVNAPGSSSGCMSFMDDDDCIAIMDRFGLPFRGKPTSGQAFVKAG